MKKLNISKNILKLILIVSGIISLILGFIGIFLPVLPTTPFVLLAASCFAKSSDKFYYWLINNKIFGSYIKDYREQKGIPLRVKIFAISFLWATILTSFYFMPLLWVKLLLIIVAIGVTIHLVSIRTKKQES